MNIKKIIRRVIYTGSIVGFISYVMCIVACGTFEISDEAVGAIFVNDEVDLPDNQKIYADYADNNYTFSLDAACVYFFNYDKETAYAGDQNFTEMTFGASLDSGDVGAQGTVAWLYQENDSNSLTAYYLFRDAEGLYFDTSDSFDHITLQREGAMTTGYDYSCAVTFEMHLPVTTFNMTMYDVAGAVVNNAVYTPEQVVDYQKFMLTDEVACVEIVCYDSEGQVLETMTVTQDNPKAVICYDAGGQVLASKLLRFLWE